MYIEFINPFIIIKGIGNKKTISISKIKKITANKKNRKENEIRAEFFGSNPHSNGLHLSRSWSERNPTINPTNIRIQIKIDAIIKLITEIIINLI